MKAIAENNRLQEVTAEIAELEREKRDLQYRAGLVDAAEFYVIGGKYIDTDFLIPDGELEVIGPFNEWTKAYQIWMARSWQHVDSCLTKYKIEKPKE